MTHRLPPLALALFALGGCAAGQVGLSSGICQDPDFDPTVPGQSCDDTSGGALDATWVAGQSTTIQFEAFAEGKYGGAYTVEAEASDGRGPLDVTATPASFDTDGEVVALSVSIDLPAEACGTVEGSVTIVHESQADGMAFNGFSGTIEDGTGAVVDCP